MILWLTIGLIGGLVLGLTGAGGAIIAIPLLVHLGHYSFRDATLISLILVIVSAVMNGWMQFKNAKPWVALQIAAFSVFGAVGAAQIKPSLSELVLKIIFLILCLFAAWRIWKPDGKAIPIHRGQALLDILFGILVGALTTFTGLGGGVLIVPWLATYRGLELRQATATSLITVLFTASFSMAGQWARFVEIASADVMLGMGGGATLAALVILAVLKNISAQRANLLRRWVLTGVIVISVLGLIE